MLNVEKIIRNGYRIEGKLSDMFDSAIVGVTAGSASKLVYSYNIMIDSLLEKGWTCSQAESYIDDTLATVLESLEDNKRPIVVHTVDHLMEE